MITSITDIQNALHAPPTHETLVQIADFGSKHLAEMQNLKPDEKQALFSRLVTENYNSQELESVVAVADQFFKEDASALTATARLHLFRYMEQKHLEKAGYLLNLPKGKRERIVYRALLTPLIKQEAAIKGCIKVLRKLPEKQREVRLAQLKLCLEAYPSIEKGFGSLLINVYPGLPEKLAFLKERGVPFTDGYRLHETLKRSLEEMAPLGVFPLLKIEVLRADDNVYKLVKELPILSQCASKEEYNGIKNIARLPDDNALCQRFHQFAKAFPKINDHFGYLLTSLYGLSDEKAEKVLTFMRGKEPFSNLTSGAMLGFFIPKIAEGEEDYPFKQFSAAFPSLVTNFLNIDCLIGMLSESGMMKTMFDLFQKYGLDKLPITDGTVLSGVIGACSIIGIDNENQMEPKYKLFADCLKAFPQIDLYGDLAGGIDKLEEKKTLELLIANKSLLPFSTASELLHMAGELNSLTWKQSLYWGGKEGLLNLFLKDVITRFPALRRDFGHLLMGYRFLAPEVWQFMENKEPFSKEQSGVSLHNHANAWALRNFKSGADRDEFYHMYSRFVAAFPEISFDWGFVTWLKDLPHAEELLPLLLNNFPDAATYFESRDQLIRFSNALYGVEENKRASQLALLQKHLEISSVNQLVDAHQLLSIPAEDQEHILTLLSKIDYLDKVKGYTEMVKRLSYFNRSEREALLSAISTFNDSEQKALFLEQLTYFPRKMHALIVQNIKTWLEISQPPITTAILDILCLMPNDALRSQPLEAEEREAISAHLIYLLENNSDDVKMLRNLLERVKTLAKDFRLGDEESPLGQTILQYEILLSDKGKVTPWTIYQKHKDRLKSPEKLPYPAFDNGHFNYEALQAAEKITPDMLPKGINLAKLQALTAAFMERYEKLDQERKDAIFSYLRIALPGFVTIESLVKTIEDPWWDYHLRATPPISETTWKLFNAVAYIAKESDVAGTELPGPEDTSANFQLKEKLLSPQENALLKLLGQVQNCPTGQAWGLEYFTQLMPFAKRGSAQERISEAIRSYFRQVIYSDAFLTKLLKGEAFGGQPLHYAQYICNSLSKELGFPITFDSHTGSIAATSLLHQKTPQELLTALFEEVRPADLHNYILDAMKGLDWSTQEGLDIYADLEKRVPPDQLNECCVLDENVMMSGLTLKAVPYLLKQYGFT